MWFVSAFSNQTLDFKGECKNNREQVFTSLLCLQQFYNDVWSRGDVKFAAHKHY